MNDEKLMTESDASMADILQQETIHQHPPCIECEAMIEMNLWWFPSLSTMVVLDTIRIGTLESNQTKKTAPFAEEVSDHQGHDAAIFRSMIARKTDHLLTCSFTRNSITAAIP